MHAYIYIVMINIIHYNHVDPTIYRVRVMVFNVAFNNISVISWQSV
jgi:hypothetical protein